MLQTTASRLPRAAALLAAACLALLAWLGAAPGAAHAAGIRLATTTALPLATASPLCTAEPRSLVYGTSAYDPGRALTHASTGLPGQPGYVAANAPAAADLVQAPLAGGRTDLCLGFTLPPNLEPALVREAGQLARPRLQDTPAVADTAEAHVSTSPNGTQAFHGDDLRALALQLPAGYTADFVSATRCADAAFAGSSYAAATCPAGAQVGEVFARMSAYAGGGATHAPLTGVALYNLMPRGGELARLGFQLTPHASLAPTKWTFGLRFADDGSGRLVATLSDAPRISYATSAIAKAGEAWGGNGADVLAAGDSRVGQPQPGAETRPLYTEGLALRLWGARSAHPTMPADFGAQGSGCTAQLSAAFAASTYLGVASAETSQPYTLSGCSALDLPASAALGGTTDLTAAPTGADLSITLPQDGTRLPAQPSALKIALPAGLELGPQLAGGASGQPLCTPEQFGADAPSQAAACPTGAQIGTLSLTSPVTSAPLVGPVYLGADPDSDDALAAVVADVALPTPEGVPVPHVKLTGELVVAPDGRVTIDFPRLPTLRLSGLRLTLRGGDQALLTSPRACGTQPGSVTLSRIVGNATVLPISLTTTGACDVAPLTPGLSLATSTALSAGRTATAAAVTRDPRSAALERVAVTLPPGALIALGAIADCGGGAASGDCPPASQLGHATLALGAGSSPYTVTGDLHLGPAPAGAFAGGVLVAQIRLGALDVGRLVAPVRYDLVGGATLIATVDLPTRVGGVALDLRRLEFDLDRDGAVRHPTACGALPAAVHVLGSGGAEGSASGAVAYPGCGSLPFEPAFTATVADTSVTGRPKVTLALTPRSADSAPATVALGIPAGLDLDPARAATACEAAAFGAGVCPAAARIGSLTGRVAIAAETVSGDAFAVKVAGDATPAVGLSIGGRFGHRLLGRTSVSAGRATVRFEALPDLPLTRWALTLDGGAGSLLRGTGAACPKGNAWTADVKAQNGAAVSRSVGASCVAAAAATATAGGPVVGLALRKTGLKLRLSGFGGRSMQSVKLTLPKQVRLNTTKLKKRGTSTVTFTGATARPTYTKGSITLATLKGDPSAVLVAVKKAGYSVAKPKAAKGKKKAKAATTKVTFKLRIAFKDGAVESRSVTLKLP